MFLQLVLYLLLQLVGLLQGLWKQFMAAIYLLVLTLGNVFQGYPHDLPGLEDLPPTPPPTPTRPLPMGLHCKPSLGLMNFSDSDTSDSDSDSIAKLSLFSDESDSDQTITNSWDELPFPEGVPTAKKMDFKDQEPKPTEPKPKGWAGPWTRPWAPSRPVSFNIPNCSHHCGDIFQGMNTMDMTFVRGCFVTDRVKNSTWAVRNSFKYMAKFQCDWDQVMIKLWPLTNILNAKPVKEKNITSKNGKDRLILIVLTILKEILPVDLDYFRLLEFVLWLFVHEFLTSFQIYWIFLDIWYVSQCDGKQFLAIEDEIVSIVLWHIASEQDKGWFKQQLYRVYYMCQNKDEYFAMVVQRMMQVDRHCCVCTTHRLYPIIPGPVPKPELMHFGDVMVPDQTYCNGGLVLDIAKTDRTYVDIIEYFLIMYTMNVPHHGTLGGELAIMWDKNKQNHEGFDTFHWDMLDTLLKTYYPYYTDNDIDQLKKSMSDLKKDVCPCKTHKFMRGADVITSMKFPIEWGAKEVGQLQKCLFILKYSTEKPFLGNIYHAPVAPKIHTVTSFSAPRSSRPSRPPRAPRPRFWPNRPMGYFGPMRRTPRRFSQKRPFQQVKGCHRRCRLQ